MQKYMGKTDLSEVKYMNLRNNFNKVLLLLDKEKYEEGENLLKEVIQRSKEQNDISLLIQSYCCYGDLLKFLNRKDEARMCLLEVIKLGDKCDYMQYEINIAHELLKDLEVEK